MLPEHSWFLSSFVIQTCDGCFVSFREHFGHKHPKYSDTLLDYGFYLLNVDNICQSVAIYQVNKRAPGDKSAHMMSSQVRALELPSFCVIADSVRHSTVCFRGEKHPRCHSP